MDMLWAWIVLTCICRRVQSVYWSQWTHYCFGTTCFQSRYVICKIGNRTRYQRHCVGEGEAFIERRSSQCNESLCSQWSSEAVVSRCKGNCHNARTTHQYDCTALNGCKKTLFKKCLNKDTCTGTWKTYSNGTCNAKCGVGERVVRERCMIGLNASSSCLGTNGTTSFRKINIECDDCLAWSEWSTWSQCNASCYRNKTRKCSFDRNSSQCEDKLFKEVKSCTEDECYSLSKHSKNVKLSFSDNRYYLILVAGGVIGGMVIIFIVWAVIRRKQDKEPKMDDNKTGQIYITEIDRYSPTDGPPRKTYSFGSHYEILDGEVYSEPFDSLGWKQKRNEAKSTSNDIYAAPSRKKREKPKTTESAIPSYRDSAHVPDTEKTLKFFDEEIYNVLNRKEETSKEDSTYYSVAADDSSRTNEKNLRDRNRQ